MLPEDSVNQGIGETLMERHFQRQMDKLKKMILSIGAMAEEGVRLAMKALENRDMELAEQVIEHDQKIDEKEVELEEECLKTLALYQPVAIDLRVIVAMIKINNDLERVGDEAVNIAERIRVICEQPKVDMGFGLKRMTEKTEEMLKLSLDSLVNLDQDLAYKVCLADDEVDHIHRDNIIKVEEAVLQHPELGRYLFNMRQISRHLERIADHATNIAEEVIYMVEGIIHRHVRL